MCLGRGVFGSRLLERNAAFPGRAAVPAAPRGFDRTRPSERARGLCRPRGVVRDSRVGGSRMVVERNFRAAVSPLVEFRGVNAM